MTTMPMSRAKASRFLVYSGGEDQVVFDAPPPTGGTG